jgi:hypothetical protein
MKPSDLRIEIILAAAAFAVALPASAMAANGSNPAARTTLEYRQAIARAEKDYAAANRGCEVLRTDERKLCAHDSAVTRGRAIIEAQSKRSITTQAAR